MQQTACTMQNTQHATDSMENRQHATLKQIACNMQQHARPTTCNSHEQRANESMLLTECNMENREHVTDSMQRTACIFETDSMQHAEP
jgi:hypothetical protein